MDVVEKPNGLLGFIQVIDLKKLHKHNKIISTVTVISRIS